jgi:hypothetical protein
MGRSWWRNWLPRSPRKTTSENRAHKPRRSRLAVEGLEDRSVPSAGQFQFAAAFTSVSQNAGNATITVNRTGGTDGVVHVQFATADGTATAGQDYTSESGTLTFADGQASNTFTVPVMNDSQVEGNETVKLTLSNPDGDATLGNPSTAILSIKDANGTHSQRFVAQAFQDLLHRPPTPAGLSHWSTLIDQGFVSRGQLISIIERSPEFRKIEITQAFQSIVGRDPLAKSVALFTSALNNGLTLGSLGSLEASLYASQEYFTKNGGTNSSFLSALFLSATGNTIDATSLDQYTQMLANGSTRKQVAIAVLNRTDALQHRVNNYFQEFLHRDATQTNLTNQVNAIRNGLRDEGLILRIVASPEYFGNLA